MACRQKQRDQKKSIKIDRPSLISLGFHVSKMNAPLVLQSDENLPTKTRGWLLVLASSIVIGACILLQVSQFSPPYATFPIDAIVSGLSNSLLSVLANISCMWLSMLGTNCFDKKKQVAMVLLTLGTLLPWVVLWCSSAAFRSSGTTIYLVAPFVTIVGFQALLIVGFRFWGRLTGVYLVSTLATRQPKRLSIQFFFFASFVLAIPLAIEIWIRKLSPTNSSIFFQPVSPMTWLPSYGGEIALCGMVAMIYAKPSGRIWTLMFLILLLDGMIHLFVHTQSLSNLAPNDPADIAYRSYMHTYFASQFLSNYLFLAFAFWLIHLAGYRWRIARRGVVFSKDAVSNPIEYDPLKDD